VIGSQSECDRANVRLQELWRRGQPSEEFVQLAMDVAAFENRRDSTAPAPIDLAGLRDRHEGDFHHDAHSGLETRT
jgi:hypothetical protein